MKIAVLGSTGMAGHVVAAYLEERGHQVYRTSRSEKDGPRSRGIDVCDFSALGAWLDQVSPEAVVNCIGLLQNACEARPDLGVLINSYLPHWLEHRYAETAVRVIHISTDCVFSGKAGQYREDDLQDGRTMYDRSKALGELRNAKDLTLRMSIIGPDIDPKGTGLFNWFMSQRGEIQGWTKAIWNGVTTVELARAIHEALNQKLTGLYHLVQPEPIDKYSLLLLFRESFHRSRVQIRQVEGLVVNKSLINSRNDFAFTVKSYPEQLRDMADWVQRHGEWYPHYREA